MSRCVAVGKRGTDWAECFQVEPGRFVCHRWTYFGFGLWLQRQRPIRFRWRFYFDGFVIGFRIGHHYDIQATCVEVFLPFMQFLLSIQDEE